MRQIHSHSHCPVESGINHPLGKNVFLIADILQFIRDPVNGDSNRSTHIKNILFDIKSKKIKIPFNHLIPAQKRKVLFFGLFQSTGKTGNFPPACKRKIIIYGGVKHVE